jgi:hypothetical protein
MKRTAHVALVVMAAAGVGGAAYSMMPREDCVRSDGGAPVDPSAPACRNSSSGSGSWHSSRSIWGSWGGSDTSSGHTSSSFVSTSPSSAAPSAGTTRGGFGSFAHAIAAHIGG